MAFRQYFSCLVLAFLAVLPAGAQTVVRAGITGPTWTAAMSCPQAQYVTASPDNLHVFRAINTTTGTAGTSQPSWNLGSQSITVDGTCTWAEWGTSGSAGSTSSGSGAAPTTLPNCTAAGTVQGLGLQFSTQTVNGISQLCGTLATASSNSVVALCTANCGNSGTASVTYNGVAPGILDGLGIANDYVIPSSTPGEFTDIGASKPSGTIETFGIVAQANTGAGTAAQIFVQPASLYFAGSGSNSGNINNAAQYLPAFYSAPGSANVLSGFSACGFNINTGLFSCTLIGSSGVGTGVITMGEGPAPSNPPPGNILLYPDTNNNLHCLTPSGGSCLASGGTPPTGSNGAVQYNNAGALGGVNDVAAGSRLASAGATSPPVFQTTPYIDVRDAGIDCTGGSDSTTAFQTMINNAPDYSKFVFPANCKVLVSTTAGSPTAITINQRYGLEFWGEGRQGNSCDTSGSGGSGVRIMDNSTYVSGGKIFYINQSQRLLFHNLTLYSTSGAVDIMMDVDQTSSPPITTDNIFENMCLYNNAAANSNFVGLRFSQTSMSNVENMIIDNLDVTCSSSAATSATSNGNGLQFGANSSNQTNEVVRRFLGNNCSVGIAGQFGNDFTVTNYSSSGDFADFEDGSYNTTFSGARSENAHTVVSITNPNESIHTIMNNEFAASNGSPIACNGGCGAVNLIGNGADSAMDFFSPAANGQNSSLFAAGNHNFNFNPLDFAGGAFVIPNGSNSQFAIWGLNYVYNSFGEFLTSPITPTVSNPRQTSPPIFLESLWNGASPTQEDWILESSVAGTNADSTLVIGNVAGPGSFTGTPSSSNQNNISTLNHWLAFNGSFSGLTLAPVSAPTILTISPLNPGGTNYTYEVVAHAGIGTTPAGATATTNNGPATLGSGSANIIYINPSPGAVYYDVYRTVCGGAGVCGTNPTGKIGSISAASTSAFVSNGGGIRFADIGQAGDGTSPSGNNTTGYFSATELSTPPAVPSAGTEYGYFKAGAGWCSYDHSGTERCPGGAGGSGTGYNGVNAQTTTYAAGSGDSGKLVVMNCSSSCTFTLYGSPSSTYWVGVISIGSVVPTISLNSKNFNGQTAIPTLLSFVPVNFYSDGTNYFGLAPNVAGSGISLTQASNGVTITSTFSAAASGRYFQSNTGSTTLGAAFSSNNTNLWSFVAPYSFTSANVEYYIATDDNSGNLYDIGIYDVNGNLVCHIGATAGTTFTGATTGMKKIAWTSSCSIVAGNRYEFATTGNASTAALGGTSSNALVALAGVHPSSGGTTSGGTLNASITIPTDNFTMSGSTTFPNFGVF